VSPARTAGATLRILAVTAALVLVAGYTVTQITRVVGRQNPAPVSATAADTVSAYLEALAGGDATTALSYGATAPVDPRLLTDEVLQASLANNPIGGVRVLETTGSNTAANVRALYRMGDRRVSASFDVLRLGGRWLLASVSTKVHLGVGPLTARLALNGAPLPTDTPELFIGTYTLTATDQRLEVTGATFFVESFRTDAAIARLSVELSDQGIDAVRDAAVKKLRACLEEKELAPSGCGFKATTKEEPRRHTIEWRVTSGAGGLRSMKVRPVGGDPTSLEGRVRIKVRATYSTTSGTVHRAASAIARVGARLGDSTTDVRFFGPD
jgi:hypothetical protein